MGGSILEDHSGVNDGVSGLRPFDAGLMESFSNGVDVLRGNVGSRNSALELIFGLVAIGINRLYKPNNSSVLTGSSRLFFVQIVETVPLGDGLPIVDTGLTCFALYSVLSFYSFDVDLKVELAHAADDHFFCFFVDVDEESGVFPFEF